MDCFQDLVWIRFLHSNYAVPWFTAARSWKCIGVLSVSSGISGASSWLSKFSLDIIEQLMELPWSSQFLIWSLWCQQGLFKLQFIDFTKIMELPWKWQCLNWSLWCQQLVVKVQFGNLRTNHGTTLKMTVSDLVPVVPIAGCQSAIWRSENKSWNYIENENVLPGACGASSWLSKCSLEILAQIMELPWKWECLIWSLWCQ